MPTIQPTLELGDARFLNDVLNEVPFIGPEAKQRALNIQVAILGAAVIPDEDATANQPPGDEADTAQEASGAVAEEDAAPESVVQAQEPASEA